MVKDYGKVGVDRVFSSTQVGRFAFFGGGDRSLVAIDICEQRLCPGRLKSPFLKTYSLQVCKGLGSKVYLSLGGYDPEYSSDKSDCMDVTLVYKRHKKESLKISKKMINVHGALREKNEIINSLSLKIKQLESFIQKQADESESTNNKRNPKSKKITSTAKWITPIPEPKDNQKTAEGVRKFPVPQHQTQPNGERITKPKISKRQYK